jgi:hypothetical protein
VARLPAWFSTDTPYGSFASLVTMPFADRPGPGDVAGSLAANHFQ